MDPCVFYQRPWGLKVLRSILVVSSSALFWVEISDVAPGICWSHFPNLGITVPSAAIGITLAFTFHTFSSS